MLTPIRLKVRGFRGFLREQEFRFDEPVVILFGENHRGKSSTLNALEWTLFGEECVGKQTNIRERVRWEVANRHAGTPDVVVELGLLGPEGTFAVRRCWTKSPRGRSAQPSLELELPDGEVVNGEEAEARLAQILGCAFCDFKTTVYQHQEAIRDIVTHEPRERDDAIDRLLGLSDYRNLLSGIKETALPARQKRITERFKEFGNNVQTIIKARENDLKEKRAAVAEVCGSVNRITGKMALALAEGVREALAGFVDEV